MDDRLAEVQRALAELRALRSTDPAATGAVAAARLAAHTLEFFWLPALASEDAGRR